MEKTTIPEFLASQAIHTLIKFNLPGQSVSEAGQANTNLQTVESIATLKWCNTSSAGMRTKLH